MYCLENRAEDENTQRLLAVCPEELTVCPEELTPVCPEELTASKIEFHSLNFLKLTFDQVIAVPFEHKVKRS